MFNESIQDLQISIDAVYLKKVKNIYGEIIRYAATAQNDLKINKKQNDIITEIKIAYKKWRKLLKP